MNDPGSLTFVLPNDQWTVADPEQTEAAGAAFLAFRAGSSPGFVTNITVTGQQVEAEVALEEVADATLADLSGTASAVTLERREPYGTDSNPGLIQLASFELEVDGDTLQLEQCQVLLKATNHGEGPVREMIYLVSLTATKSDVRDAVPDFQSFLRTIVVAS